MKITRMHLRVVSFLVAIMVFLNYDKVEGLTKKENEALDRQLQLLNKPAVKTIETEYGDIYDCVDFYQQPAFDHPLLKNHTFHPQMKPTFSLTKRDDESSTFKTSTKIGLKDGGCPMGTVPIRRTTKEDLIRERRANRFNSSYATGTFHFALVETPDDQNNKFSGAGAWMSVYAPNVHNNQWSASVVKVENGRDQIQAGWRVDPILYGDKRARFFSLFKSGLTQCFNTRCPGFVIVNQEVPLDHAFPKNSKPGEIYEERFYIQKDLKSGQWWLRYGVDSIQLGFWPPQLFGALKGFASRAAWGGEAFSSGPTFPPMGAGNFPGKLESSTDAFCRAISIIDFTGKNRDAGPASKLEDAPALYRVTDKQTNDGVFRHAVFFGGPGSNK